MSAPLPDGGPLKPREGESIDDMMRRLNSMRHTLAIDESERGLILQALAWLSLKYPGFDDALADIALRIDNKLPTGRPQMYDEFRMIETRHVVDRLEKAAPPILPP